MVFGEALIHECIAALLRESGDCLGWQRVNVGGESEFCLNVALSLLALVYSLAEYIRVFVVEQKRQTGDQFNLLRVS